MPAAVAKTSSSCASAEDSLEDSIGGAPATISEALNPAVVARYAIFRRTAAPADLPPPINSLADQVSFALGRYNPAYVRQLTERIGGRRLFVVPGLPPHVEVPPARCLPRRLRPQRPQLVARQLKRERQPIACIVAVVPSGARNELPGEECPRFRDVTKYEYLSSGAFGGVEQAGILPDGIATVRVHFSRTPVVQVPVVENFYLYKVDSSLRRKLLRQLGSIFRQLENPPSRRTRAQRRKLQRELFARLKRTSVS